MELKRKKEKCDSSFGLPIEKTFKVFEPQMDTD
jgi:hypothetical protein